MHEASQEQCDQKFYIHAMFLFLFYCFIWVVVVGILPPFLPEAFRTI